MMARPSEEATHATPLAGTGGLDAMSVSILYGIKAMHTNLISSVRLGRQVLPSSRA